LLISLHGDLLDPAAGKGGHYANCPTDKWDSHFKPYVMGDVEVCYEASNAIQEKLDKSKVYEIPLAHPTVRGKFRWFQPPSRSWVYDNIMSPASRVLMKMMGRGLHIDQPELDSQERIFPIMVNEARDKMRVSSPEIEAWCQAQQETDPAWALDLEDKTTLRTLLFEILDLPVQRFTKSGKQKYGENPEDIAGLPREVQLEYAALDKFTLNKLSVDHAEVRPLQEYRKVFKQYSTYVRPIRNIMTIGLDKKKRVKEQHLGMDGRIHGSFLLTGTRGGRLSSRDPNLQQLPNDSIVKRMFSSRFGERGCLYTADFSQIELRLLAAASGDENMMEAYFKDLDLHSLTTARIFNLDYEQFSKGNMKKLQDAGKGKEAKDLELKRKIGKTCNFLTGYGGGAFGLQTTLANAQVYLPLEECEDIIEKFFGSYPILKMHLAYYKQFIKQKGVAVSIFGRVRIFDEVFGEDKEAEGKALRAGANHLIQATASDMMLICLHVIEFLMRDRGLESVLVSTVHDSLLVDTVTTELPQVHEIVDSVLNNIPDVLKLVFGDGYDASWCLVPFGGDSEVGLNYLDVKKIPKDNIDWDKLLHAKED